MPADNVVAATGAQNVLLFWPARPGPALPRDPPFANLYEWVWMITKDWFPTTVILFRAGSLLPWRSRSLGNHFLIRLIAMYFWQSLPCILPEESDAPIQTFTADLPEARALRSRRGLR